MATTFIYALCEPGTSVIRYIGKANDPVSRFKRHLRESIKTDTYLGRWLRILAGRGEKPLLEILDEVPESQWQFWEREYIRVFRAVGMRLVNTTDGGDGMSVGHPVSEKTRGKISRSHLGKKASNETRQKLRLGAKNRPRVSQETRLKMSVAHINPSAETRAKRSASLSGDKNYNFGKPMSIEALERLSTSQKARWARLRAQKEFQHGY